LESNTFEAVDQQQKQKKYILNVNSNYN
jgi:hypothetical protein